MIKFRSAILLVLFLLVGLSAFPTVYSFRVQCTKKGDPALLQVFNKIPDRQSYMLPSGTTLYFSGGYFKNLGIAQNRLDVVKNLGIDKAFIRVFKNKAYLSDRVSANMLNALMKDYKDNLAKADSLTEVAVEKQTDTKQEERTYTRAEFAALKRSRRIAKEEEADVGNNELVEKAKKREEDIKSDRDDVEESFEVKEEPVYRILLDVSAGNNALSSDFDAVNEIIYENNVGNKNYFTVGFFKGLEEAESELGRYKSQLNKNDLKVVGLYRGSLISKELAAQLQEQYRKSNPK